MYTFLSKKTGFWMSKNLSRNPANQNFPLEALTNGLSDNLDKIRSLTNGSTDIIIRQFNFNKEKTLYAALIFVDGLSDAKTINKSIIDPLMFKTCQAVIKESVEKNDICCIGNSMVSVGDVKTAGSFDEVIEGFLSGDAVLLIDGFNSALIISCKGWDKRNITEPAAESVIRGPRESFTESIRTNTSMLRLKIKNPDLVLETLTLGQRTRTTVCLSYIKSIANTELVEAVKARVNAINTDSILESGYIEQYIEDAPFSLFSTIGYSEKPDVIAAKLLEGRVAILVDGTPIVLTAPMFFIESFQSAEDYYSRPYFMSMLRIVRYIAFFINVLMPAIYVAVTTYHQELLPTALLLTMAKAREGVPFPAAIESLIMIMAFEILREAGVRLPRPIGQAMSIVGALVMGEAAVSAGLISAPMVIVIAITAVSIFAVPSQADSAAILRIIFILLAAVMGNFGIAIGFLGTLVHLSSLKSFGFPYLSPIVPMQPGASTDSLVRAPLWAMLKRPAGMARGDETRRVFNVPPVKQADYNGEE